MLETGLMIQICPWMGPLHFPFSPLMDQFGIGLEACSMLLKASDLSCLLVFVPLI